MKQKLRIPAIRTKEYSWATYWNRASQGEQCTPRSRRM